MDVFTNGKDKSNLYAWELTEKQKQDIIEGKYLIVEGVGAPWFKIKDRKKE